MSYQQGQDYDNRWQPQYSDNRGYKDPYYKNTDNINYNNYHYNNYDRNYPQMMTTTTTSTTEVYYPNLKDDEKSLEGYITRFESGDRSGIPGGMTTISVLVAVSKWN